MAAMLALASGFLYAASTIALRIALLRNSDAALGAFLMVSTGFLVATVATLPNIAAESVLTTSVAVFAFAGLLAPGVSMLFFTMAVRDAGSARPALVVGAAPLVAVIIALLVLDEPLSLPLIGGAVLIVLGGTAVLRERERPEHFRNLAIVFAACSMVLFAVRDSVVRWAAIDAAASPPVGSAAALGAGTLALATYLLGRRGWRAFDIRRADVFRFLPAGVLFGLSYVALFEAYYRGTITVVSPMVATESLWTVLLAALILRRAELIGRQLAVGTLFVVSGGVLIAIFQ